MKKLLLLGMMSLTSISFGQEVISTQGDTYSNGSGIIDFTIGETVIQTVGNASNDITQGFHQTNWNFVSVEEFQPDVQVNVYPNPMDEHLVIAKGDDKAATYELFDANGRIISEGSLTESKTLIDTKALSPASYSIRIQNNEGADLKVFKLLKIE